MPDWSQISPRLSLRIAADARHIPTQAQVDQVWEVALGQGEEAALSLNTRYGGRVGMARLVILFRVEQRSIFEAQTFSRPPQISALAPDAIQVDAEVISGVTLKALFWARHSQAVVGRLTLQNSSGKKQALRAEIFVQAMIGEADLPMSRLKLDSRVKGLDTALGISKVGELHPAILLEGAEAMPATKLSSPLEIEAGKSITLRFAHTGYPSLESSVQEAYRLLQEDWAKPLADLDARQKSTLQISTGDDALDAAILFSSHQALQALIQHPRLPHPGAVMQRIPSLTPQDDSAPMLDVFLLGVALIALDPKLAQGLVKNYLAAQLKDGTILQAGALLPPFLAQLSALIYRHTGDQKFVAEVLPKLFKFYGRWFAADRDVDGDAFPEWQANTQAQQQYHILFSDFRREGSLVDIQWIEAPDLASYLLNEGSALAALCDAVRKKSEWKKIEKTHTRLQSTLQKSWDGQRFFYRDRDTHQRLQGEKIYSGTGEETLTRSVKLGSPNRLVVRSGGGVSHPPRLKVTISGLDFKGQAATEVLENFTWYRSFGAATTQTIWTQIDNLEVQGLSRVYNIEVTTIDLSRHDLSLVLPYTTFAVDSQQSDTLLEQITAEYTAKFGLVVDPQDEVGKRVFMPWMTLFGLALLREGEARLSLDLFERITRAQVQTLIQQGHFYQWYDGHKGEGLGLPDHVSGMIPLYWLLNLIGVFVRDAHTVELLGELVFKRRVQVNQHGVQIARSSRKTAIKFPNGKVVELPADAPPQIITDAG